jgi:hypothetical protein
MSVVRTGIEDNHLQLGVNAFITRYAQESTSLSGAEEPQNRTIVVVRLLQ